MAVNAQGGAAGLPWGSGGRRFESGCPDHLTRRLRPFVHSAPLSRC